MKRTATTKKAKTPKPQTNGNGLFDFDEAEDEKYWQELSQRPFDSLTLDELHYLAARTTYNNAKAGRRFKVYDRY